MVLILCILLGIAIGQHIKIAVSPELQAFVKSSWALAETKALPAARSAVKSIQSTTQKRTATATEGAE